METDGRLAGPGLYDHRIILRRHKIFQRRISLRAGHSVLHANLHCFQLVAGILEPVPILNKRCCVARQLFLMLRQLDGDVIIHWNHQVIMILLQLAFQGLERSLRLLCVKESQQFPVRVPGGIARVEPAAIVGRHLRPQPVQRFRQREHLPCKAFYQQYLDFHLSFPSSSAAVTFHLPSSHTIPKLTGVRMQNVTIISGQ